jgi:hypothetical protein
MRHSKHDDADLAEVKAILGRLQRISRNPREGGAQTGDDLDLAAPRSLRSGMAESMAEGSPSIPAQVNARRFVKAAVLLLVPLMAVVAGVVIFADRDGQSDAVVKERRADVAPESRLPIGIPAPAQKVLRPAADEARKPAAEATQRPATEAAPKSPALQASDLMASGQVQAARAALLRAMQDDSADVAFALALSYDPNYLATIPAADAGPDVAEAKRWYRTWYDIAVKQGLVSDRVPLDRIIRSMN